MKRYAALALSFLILSCSSPNSPRPAEPAYEPGGSDKLLERIGQFIGEPTLTDSALNDFSSYFSTTFENKGSATVLIGDKDSVVFFKTIGFNNYATGEKTNDSSLSDVGSVSKAFTAEAIMILKSRGLLSYSDSLRKYFPELPYPGVTIRHLLNHTAGLPDEAAIEEFADSDMVYHNDDVIDLAAKKSIPARFPPGERWEYSNFGYTLLASIVEKVSATSFSDFLNAEIFRPLGMRRSRIYTTRYSGEVIPNLTYGYYWNEESHSFDLPQNSPDYKFVRNWGITGPGFIVTTARELFMWDRALTRNALLSKAEQDEAYVPARLRDGSIAQIFDTPDLTYGFGWFMNSDPKGGKVIWHSGGWPGYITCNLRILDKDRTVIIFVTADPLHKEW